MKTVNISLEVEYFERKNELPREYTWQKIVDMGIDAAKREQEKRLYWSIQKQTEAKNPGCTLELVKVS
jgi:hypothetical protein